MKGGSMVPLPAQRHPKRELPLEDQAAGEEGPPKVGSHRVEGGPGWNYPSHLGHGLSTCEQIVVASEVHNPVRAHDLLRRMPDDVL